MKTNNVLDYHRYDIYNEQSPRMIWSLLQLWIKRLVNLQEEQSTYMGSVSVFGQRSCQNRDNCKLTITDHNLNQRDRQIEPSCFTVSTKGLCKGDPQDDDVRNNYCSSCHESHWKPRLFLKYASTKVNKLVRMSLWWSWISCFPYNILYAQEISLVRNIVNLKTIAIYNRLTGVYGYNLCSKPPNTESRLVRIVSKIRTGILRTEFTMNGNMFKMKTARKSATLRLYKANTRNAAKTGKNYRISLHISRKRILEAHLLITNE